MNLVIGVLCKYKRFVFESIEEAEAVKEKFLKLKYDQAQELKRYQPSKKLYRVKDRQKKQSIYMDCALLKSEKMARKLGMRCLDLVRPAIDVLRQLVKTTFDFHFPLEPPILSPSSSQIS